MAKDPRLKAVGVEGYNKPKRTPTHPTKSHVEVVVVYPTADATSSLQANCCKICNSCLPFQFAVVKNVFQVARNDSVINAKEIAKGKMSGAYWSNKVKW